MNRIKQDCKVSGTLFFGENYEIDYGEFGIIIDDSYDNKLQSILKSALEFYVFNIGETIRLEILEKYDLFKGFNLLIIEINRNTIKFKAIKSN